ncbi:MAG: nitroreductase [Tardiphaga sp.]|jgi:5,6-dimethylbenzimidazole synthase|nr:nitroreductase [Tardiphaga sp.]
MTAPDFDAGFRAKLHDLFAWRRDVRQFRRDPLPDGVLDRLIEAACLAPSVGLSQPWRYVIVDDPARRRRVRDSFEACNADALASYGDDLAARYAKLKLAGLDDAPCHLAVFADRDTLTGHHLGRRTMPEMADYSVVAAISTLWLAARAEAIGVGWVSILDPAAVIAALDVSPAWRLIGYLCIGYPHDHTEMPELARAGWEQRRPAADYIVRR